MQDVSAAELGAFRACIRWNAETFRADFISGSSLDGGWRRLLTYGSADAMLPMAVWLKDRSLGLKITTTPTTRFVMYDYRSSDSDALRRDGT